MWLLRPSDGARLGATGRSRRRTEPGEGVPRCARRFGWDRGGCDGTGRPSLWSRRRFPGPSPPHWLTRRRGPRLTARRRPATPHPGRPAPARGVRVRCPTSPSGRRTRLAGSVLAQGADRLRHALAVLGVGGVEVCEVLLDHVVAGDLG